MTAVTIVGAAGGIGASVTGELVRQGLFDVLHLVDLRTNVLEADRIDLTESVVGTGLRPPRITVEDPHSAREMLEASDLVICAATLGEKPGQSRSSFAAVNWELLESLVPVISRAAGTEGTILLITNPIDSLAERLAREPSIPERERIVGYSLNDSTRLRVALGAELGVEPQRVHAEALGVHGEQLVPAFSGVRIDGAPVDVDAEKRDRAIEWMNGWFARWHALGSGRSSTRSTGAGVAELVKAMRDGRVIPASVSTDSIDFLPDGAFVGFPTTFENGRARPQSGSTLSDAERSALVEAAVTVRRLADGLGRP